MTTLFPAVLPDDNIGDVARQQSKERTRERIVLDLEGLANRLKQLRGERTYDEMADITGVSAARNEPGPYGVAPPGTALQELVREEVRQEVKRLMAVKDDAPADESEVPGKNRRKPR